MTDPNNQNFFDPTAPAETPVTPWWKRNRTYLIGGGVLGVVIVMGLVGMFVYQSLSLKGDAALRLAEAERLAQETSAECEGEADVEACKARARSDAAQQTGQVEVCSGLTGQQLKNCVVLIARDEADPEVCVMLEGDEQVGCEDSAYLVLAKQEDKIEICAEIQDANVRSSCEQQIAPADTTALDAAVSSGNPQNCATLTADNLGACEDVFTSIDSDGDGLSLFEEYKLGTSDEAQDTDGDGYTDAQEVSSGHDPLH